ncbi:MAG: heavy-metal-associated domain-containing protein [Christensenellaceae bacterium]|jgi:Cd2+/Zn2+-exporting ATPase|nr:heavy-metal-associated domain-containing protein [Christensenellaceae bacterium]
MKLVYKLENICCAKCTDSIERATSKVDGVSKCSVSFIAGKMTIEVADDKLNTIDAVIEKIVKNVEPHATFKRLN